MHGIGLTMPASANLAWLRPIQAVSRFIAEPEWPRPIAAVNRPFVVASAAKRPMQRRIRPGSMGCRARYAGYP
ncbi:MAG: hypothetical protein AB7Q97_27515 [Gammaproteobacteria bacterium]